MEIYLHLLWTTALVACGALIYTFFFPDWLTRASRKDTYLTSLQTILQQHAEQVDRLLAAQEATHRAIGGMVEHMSEATAKQAEAFTAYLTSFTTTEPTRHWVTSDGPTASMDELVRLGFPVQASAEEQTAWMEAYLAQQPW